LRIARRRPRQFDRASWLSFFGVVCLLLLGLLQWQKAIRETVAKPNQLLPLLTIRLGAVYLDSPEPGKMTAWIRIKNSGNAPAYNVKSWQNFMRGVPGQNPFDQERPTENEVFLGDGQEVNLSSTLTVTPEQIDALSNKVSALYVWGEQITRILESSPIVSSSKAL